MTNKYEINYNKAKIAYGPETGCITRCCLQATCTAINTVPGFDVYMTRLRWTIASMLYTRCNRMV